MASDASLTLRELFGGQNGALPADLVQALQPQLTLKLGQAMPDVSWDNLQDYVTGKLSEMLGIPLFSSVLVPAWKKYRDVEAAFDSSDEKEQCVWLADHTLESAHHPKLQVRYQSIAKTLAELTVTVSLTVSGFGLLIRSGRIVGVKTGSLSGEGAVALGSVRVPKDFGTIALGPEVHFDEAISVNE